MWNKKIMENLKKKTNYSIWSRSPWWISQIANRHNAIIEKKIIDGIAYFRAKW